MPIIIFKLLILAAIFTLILYPFFSQPAQAQAADAEGDKRRSLLREKDTLYAAIKELDFDYNMGKLSQEDYHNLRSSYQHQAAELLKRLDEAGPSPSGENKSGGRRN